MDWAVARDIFIIVLAIVSIITLIVLIVVAWSLWSLVQLIRLELRPILQSLNQTSQTVRGTTEFMTGLALVPVARTVGIVAAVLGLLRALRARRR
jgi:hypothetical protein